MAYERYILSGRKPVRCDDAEHWASWFRLPVNWIVAHDSLGEVRVSTVFLGVDQADRTLDEGYIEPELFETQIFGGEWDHYCSRCATWEDALDVHQGAIKLVNSENVVIEEDAPHAKQ